MVLQMHSARVILPDFWKLGPNMDATETPIPEEVWPIEKNWIN